MEYFVYSLNLNLKKYQLDNGIISKKEYTDWSVQYNGDFSYINKCDLKIVKHQENNTIKEEKPIKTDYKKYFKFFDQFNGH